MCDERRLEDGIQYLKNRMMQYAITNSRFMNPALLWIADRKSRIFPVSVCPTAQIPTKRQDVLFKLPLECLYVFSRALAPAELFPSLEQVLWRNDPREDILVYFHPLCRYGRIRYSDFQEGVRTNEEAL